MTTLLPRSFIANIVHQGTRLDGLISNDLRESYDGPIFEYARNLLENTTEPIDSLYFVGHSLGGALAQIVAAQLHGLQKQGDLAGSEDTAIRSYAFNSPGLLLSSRKFSVNIDDLYETATIIDSENDVVGDVDVHIGSVYDIDCVFEDVLAGCHRIQNAICALYEHCDATQSHNPDLLQSFCEYSEDNPGAVMTDVYYDLEW